MPVEHKRIRLFISYSRRDQELRAELDKQLSPLKRLGIINVWHDRQIDPGQEWDREIKRNLEEADIILLLISADFMASDYAWSEEMERALVRHEAGEARVIPVILQPCDWELAPFSRIQALPRDAKAVSTWGNRAEALADVARGVRVVAQGIANNPLKRPVAPTPQEPEVAPRVRERQQAIAVAATTAEPSMGQIEPNEIKTNPIDGQPYVWIPPGKFRMGCSPGDAECHRDERPAHKVTITRGFWIGQTPITQAAWTRVMGENPSHFKGEDRPVEQMSWEDAKKFCEKAGMRLPTEAEWEYAARGGSGEVRYGALEEIAWCSGNSGNQTHPVGKKKPNAWGLHDMLGNVWEWVNDWYGEYGAGAATDPPGPASGEHKVVRGGSWSDDPDVIRVSDRVGGEPSNRGNYIGFRCAGELR